MSSMVRMNNEVLKWNIKNVFFLNCSDSLFQNLLVRHQMYSSPTIHHWCKCGVFCTTETAFNSDTRHMVVVRLKAG